MNAVIVTGSLGLIGGYVSKELSKKGFVVIGIDNDTRSSLFADINKLSSGELVSVNNENRVDKHFGIDIRNYEDLSNVFKEVSSSYNVKGVVHCAAQPSHDWAASDVFTDFGINAQGTLNVCECFKNFASSSTLIYLSTNKVYGDTPNYLPLIELETRYELPQEHKYYDGIDASMSIDHTKHSLFGCSKAAGDLYVQEYGRYYGLKTVCLRVGCLTGGSHRGTKLHGFMNYLIKCALSKKTYSVIGYKGKQVRDNVHAGDVARLCELIISSDLDLSKFPIVANVGGGRKNSVSILELISILKQDFDLHLDYTVESDSRIGDHQWYISSNTLLTELFGWSPELSLNSIIDETTSCLG